MHIPKPIKDIPAENLVKKYFILSFNIITSIATGKIIPCAFLNDSKKVIINKNNSEYLSIYMSILWNSVNTKI